MNTFLRTILYPFAGSLVIHAILIIFLFQIGVIRWYSPPPPEQAAAPRPPRPTDIKLEEWAGNGEEMRDLDRPTFDPAFVQFAQGMKALMNQPALSLDPSGDFGKTSRINTPPKSPAAYELESRFQQPQERPIIGAGGPDGEPTENRLPMLDRGRLPPIIGKPDASPRSMATPPSTPAKARPNTGQGQQQPSNQENAQKASKRDGAPGDPAPMGDSEVDAASKSGTAAIKLGGGVKARFGRKVRTVRPRFLPAAYVDLLEIGRAVLRFEIDIDATGRVVAVHPLQKSNIATIDQPVSRALYEWRFEPAVGADGKPRATTLTWTVVVQ